MRLVLLLKKAVMVVVLKTKIKKEKASGAVKLRYAVLKKIILVSVMNVKNFLAKNILKNYVNPIKKIKNINIGMDCQAT